MKAVALVLMQGYDASDYFHQIIANLGARNENNLFSE